MSELHKGHRQRVRQRLLKEGMENMQPHEVLEFLLFHVIRRRNTNELAHELLNTFGSLADVFNAPRSELMKINGVGDKTATFLNMMVPTMQAYLNSYQNDRLYLMGLEKYGKYLYEKYLGSTVEKMSVLCMDSTYKLVGFSWVGSGDSSKVVFSAKSIIEAVLKYPCTKVVIAHNHPSELLIPTIDDAELTKKIKNLLAALGIQLEDHLIIGNEDFVSLRCSKIFTDIFDDAF